MAAYPTAYDPLTQIGGFAGGNLADQLRRSRLPVEPQRWVQSLPAPPTDTPIPDDYMALGANPAPLPAPRSAQPAPPMWGIGKGKPTGTSGLNTVGQALEHARSQPVETTVDMSDNRPTLHDLPTPPVQYPAEPPPPMRLSQLSSLRAQGRELANAPLNTDVTADSWGLPQVGETKPMTKKHGVLMGLLEGALLGGAAGGWKGAIGGAATGGIAGAVDPKLIYALERKQAQDRLQGDINTEFGNRTKEAQLGDIAAQAHQRNLEPILEQYKIEEQNRRADAAETGRNSRSQAAIDAANKRHQADIDTRKALADAKERAKVDVTVGGKTYRVSPEAAARIKVQQTQNAQKPSPAREAALRAVIQEEAEQDALNRRKDTDESISKLREKGRAITHDPKPSPDGKETWWYPKVSMSDADEDAVREVNREIADLQRESDNQQRIAETAAADKRKAEAEARAGGEQPQWKGGSKPAKPPASSGFSQRTWSKSKWIAANPDKAGRVDEAATAAKSKGYKVVE